MAGAVFPSSEEPDARRQSAEVSKERASRALCNFLHEVFAAVAEYLFGRYSPGLAAVFVTRSVCMTPPGKKVTCKKHGVSDSAKYLPIIAGGADAERVHLDAGHVFLQYAQGFGGGQAAGFFQDALNSSFDEGSAAAAGVNDALIEGVVNDGLGNFLGQPAGSVVFAEALALFLGDDVLVQSGRDLPGLVGPVEPFHLAGGFHQIGALADFRGPGEQVGVDDAVEVGLLSQDAALEQVVRPFVGVAGHVAEELLLDDGGDEAGDVGVPDEEPVAVDVVGGGVLAQGDLQQVLPQTALDGDGGVIAVGA